MITQGTTAHINVDIIGLLLHLAGAPTQTNFQLFRMKLAGILCVESTLRYCFFGSVLANQLATKLIAIGKLHFNQVKLLT